MHKLFLPDPRINCMVYLAIDTCHCPQMALYFYTLAASLTPSQETSLHSNDHLSTNLSSPPLHNYQCTQPESTHDQMCHAASTMSRRFPQFHGIILHPSIAYPLPKLYG